MKAKELISNIIGVIGILVFLYIAYFVIVTIVCLDGTPTGSLYEDLGMVQVRHWCGQFLRWAISLAR